MSSTDDYFFDGVFKTEPYVTIEYALNILIFIVSVLGIAGNMVTVSIFCRFGLKKSSNLLILCLAVADAAYLLGITNIPLHIYIRRLDNVGFFVSQDLAFFLYILFHCAVFLENIGKVASLFLPVLIALERIVAVFFPLHFSRVVRPDLLKALVVLFFPTGIPVYVSYCLMFKFAYRNNAELNVTAGVMLRSDDFVSAIERYRMVCEVYTIMCGPVCTGIVILACIAVGAKVHIQMKKRGRLLGSSKHNHQDDNPEIIKHSIPFKVEEKNKSEKLDSQFQDEHSYAEWDTHTTTSPSVNTNAKITSQKQILRLGVLGTFSFGRKTPETSKSIRRRDSSFKIGVKTTKTTKILMSVCAFYSLNGLYGYISVALLKSTVSGIADGVLIHRISILIMCFNSGINFIIYSYFNQNFRNQYRKIFCKCRATGNRHQ